MHPLPPPNFLFEPHPWTKLWSFKCLHPLCSDNIHGRWHAGIVLCNLYTVAHEILTSFNSVGTGERKMKWFAKAFLPVRRHSTWTWGVWHRIPQGEVGMQSSWGWGREQGGGSAATQHSEHLPELRAAVADSGSHHIFNKLSFSPACSTPESFNLAAVTAVFTPHFSTPSPEAQLKCSLFCASLVRF